MTCMVFSSMYNVADAECILGSVDGTGLCNLAGDMRVGRRTETNQRILKEGYLAFKIAGCKLTQSSLSLEIFHRLSTMN